MTTGRFTDVIRRPHFSALLIMCLSLQSNALADMARTQGVFEGVYHQDRWGVGHYLYFIVHPDLHAKLAKYEDRLVRVEVTKGTQPMNPGPAVMLAVGRIEELPQPPVGIRVKTRPSKITANRPFQLVVEVTNNSEDDSLLYPLAVVSTVRQPVTDSGQRSNDPSYLVKDYTTGQLSVGCARTQMEAWTAFHGRANLQGCGGQLLLPPRASYVWVTSFAEGVPALDGELEIEVSYALADPKAPFGVWRSEGRFEKWQALPVQQARSENLDTIPDERTLLLSGIDCTAEEDGWTRFRLKLLPANGGTVRVPGTIDRASGKEDPEKYAQLARVEGAAKDGSAVELDAVRLPQSDTRSGIALWVEIPKTGAVIEGRFRKHSRFAQPITRLSLCVLTDHGIETLVLSDDFKDQDVPPTTAYGAVTGGVKLRVRPARAVFKGTEPMRFHLQAVNVSDEPVCWRMPSNGIGDNVIIEIDGRKVALPERKPEYIGGWAAQWTCQTPEEWTITLPDSVKCAPGQHTIRYIVVAEGGTYKNANNELIPILRGELVSNRANYSVE